MSQLIHRVLGPLRPDRLRWVLDYHGLAGAPAAALDDTARRNHVTVGMITVQAAKVRAAGAALPLPPSVVTSVMRPTEPGEDRLGRIRIARTLGLPPPPGPPEPAPAPDVSTPPLMATARSAVRILSATGPLDMPTLLDALTRARRWKGSSTLTAGLLADALTAVDATQDGNGRWHAPPGFPVPEGYRVIIAAGAGRDLTRREVIDILTAAGYTASSADGLMSSTHPLFVHVDRNRYRVLTSPDGQGDGRPLA